MSINQASKVGDLLAADPDDLTDEEIAEIPVAVQRGLQEVEAGCVKMRAQAVAKSLLRFGFPSS